MTITEQEQRVILFTNLLRRQQYDKVLNVAANRQALLSVDDANKKNQILISVERAKITQANKRWMRISRSEFARMGDCELGEVIFSLYTRSNEGLVITKNSNFEYILMYKGVAKQQYPDYWQEVCAE